MTVTRTYIFTAICILFSTSITTAQTPVRKSATAIYHSIQQLNFLGSVLYVAAHPDDENTKLISHFANHVHARTAYLSLTRGDGGQNLIGPELREMLGVIRTNELVQARRIDGGEQLFSRANDFGFSKMPDETLEIWDKEQVLADVVWAIRTFKPDIIINRFDHRSPGTTHGHHTASALLSLEAIDLANDPSHYSDQLKHTSVWEVNRAFFNTSWWFYGSQEKMDAADKSNFIALKTGFYDPLSGLSNSEISALSRSCHQSQGFGSTGARGEEIEYLELLRGKLPEDKASVFEGINTSWTRVKGGAAIGKILARVEKEFDFNHPEKSLKDLLQAYRLIEKLEDAHWRNIKLEQISAIIQACAGIFLEVSSAEHWIVAGETVDLNLEFIARNTEVALNAIFIDNQKIKAFQSTTLKINQKTNRKENYQISNETPLTNAYWLNEEQTLGMYRVSDPLLIGKPLTEQPIRMSAEFVILGEKITFSCPLIYKENDPVLGEVYKPVEIVPEVAVSSSEDVILFSDNQTKQIPIQVKALRASVNAKVQLNTPEGWKISPAFHEVSIAQKGMEKTVYFEITPPNNPIESNMTPTVQVGEKRYTQKLVTTTYNHIPHQTIFLPATVKLVKIDVQIKGKKVGYIDGAGDVIPASLEQIGYEVTRILPEQITPEFLKPFDAIVLGIRAYNTVDALKFKQADLLNFVKNGGNLIVQYNTTGALVVDSLAPYPLKISRDRVTEEHAEVRFLAPNHPVLQTPNKITATDFEGWVQERGLYFPSSWGAEFTAILSCNDKNETPKDGGLLIAPYGKGNYIYTGYSWFREFPAGVSGAYRIFANLISLGK